MGYNEAFKTGLDSVADPFAIINARIEDARKRKLDAETKEHDEMNELSQAMQLLKQERDYTQENQRQKADLDLKLELNKAIISGELKTSDDVRRFLDEKEGNSKTNGVLKPPASVLDKFGMLSRQGIPQTKMKVDESTESSPIPQSFEIDGKSYTRTGTSTKDIDRELKETNLALKKKQLAKPTPTVESEMLKKEAMKYAEAKPAIDSASNLISEMKKSFKAGDLSKNVKKGDVIGGWGQKAYGLMESFGANSGANADLKTYFNTRDSFLSIISKGVLKESGVLTDQDIARAKKAFPDPMGTKEEIEQGWAVLDSIIGSAQKRYDELKGTQLSEPENEDSSESDEISPEDIDAELKRRGLK